ncbi:thiol-specific monooxygenase [Durotheca rogersii]|uniref:thiol-specific monooxygenase n=1 Tax=Durotheca rogersii TaxID=419775 RepID=UPI0022205365|nr:thiol-specific monooxygenase [Durotheca rogersii]KAI5861941.1 thiol-specific monooxygenase [Durotheca rogersii]
MANPIRRVAVIGAGPAGAIATDALVKEQAFDEIRVFERHAVVGGTWVYSPDLVPGIPSLRALVEQRADRPIPVPDRFPCETARAESNSHRNRYSDTGVHEALHSNLPPSTMSFTQEPLPDTLSERTLADFGPDAPFRHRQVVRDWVEQIFARGGHEKLVSLNTTVERAEKKTDSPGQAWVLTLRQEAPGARDRWWQEEFDAVVVAAGHYNVPYVPDIPGLVEYEERHPGSIMHSKHYRGAEAFAGKKVVVVGGSVSAVDAIHEIRAVARRPVIASVRRPLPAFGWTPFVHPHVALRSAIARLDPAARRVEFADGSVADGVDVVYFATGYDFSFPYLQSGGGEEKGQGRQLPPVEIRNRRIDGLYQHVFSRRDPTMAFIGMITGGLTFRVFEWQAVAAARVFAGRGTLPSREEMDKWERERVADVGDGLPFFNIAFDYEGYFEGLRALAGDPAPGTTGRVLPKYEEQWEKEVGLVVEAKERWWERERKMAEDAEGV